MASNQRTAELVQNIQKSHDLLSQRCAELDEELPSMDQGMSPRLMEDGIAAGARMAMIDASEELQCLMRGPQMHLTYPLHTATVSLHALVNLGLHSLVPIGEGKSYDEIASKASMDPSLVKRIFRHAMSRFIFYEEPKGVVRHNAVSQHLAESSETRQFISMVEDEMRPASCHIVHAIKKWPDAQEPTHSGYQLAHNTDFSFFEFLGQDPARAKRFGDAMTWFSNGPGMQVSFLASAYPWADLGKATVVDIGGSFATASIAVANKFPDLSFVVQDLPPVVAQGRQQVHYPAITFEEYDFFKPQSVQNANIYLLRQILHDWSDEYAAKILKNIVGAMSKTSKILIMEKVLPEYGAVPISLEQVMRGFDLAMIEIQNGKERDMDDWKALLRKAAPNLVVERIFAPQGSQLHLIEAGLE